MPNFKDDKSKFTMKNMNYYKGKHAASEANSPYNKNGHEAMHGKLGGGGRALKAGKTLSAVASNMAEMMVNTMTGGMLNKGVSKFGGKTNAADLKNQIKYKKVLPEITEELVNTPVQNFLKDYHHGLKNNKLNSEIATERVLNRTMKKNLKKKTAGYTPQTKSRKDPSTDVTPQSKKK